MIVKQHYACKQPFYKEIQISDKKIKEIRKKEELKLIFKPS